MEPRPATPEPPEGAEPLSVPVSAAAVLAALCGAAGDLSGAVVHVGARPELDLDEVAAMAGGDLSRALASYWSQTRRLAALVSRGAAGGTEVVAVRRPVGHWRQSTGRPRVDLVEQYEALCRLGPSAGTAVEDLLADRDDTDRCEVEVVSQRRDLGAALGGPATLCEQRRVLRLVARYAPWRDRRVRRLAEVEALVDEVWPEPDDEVRGLWGAATR